MPKSVHITTPIDPLEVRIKRLHIPKARQKELLAIMDEAWARYSNLEQVPENGMNDTGKKRKRAAAA
ncbi:MAG: hypothetical protein P4L26_12035 [Terracidiphilus sp.]|jgi:hypothetical protein|nr:hypothetical protein [Terracidiphilus sp.]